MKRILINLEDEEYDEFMDMIAEVTLCTTIEYAILNGIVLPESDTASSNNKYAIIFESDEDLDKVDISGFGNLLGMEDLPDLVTVRKLPDKMPEILGHFDTYQNGYAKGNNDVLDKLEGKWGVYDESVKNDNSSTTDTH